MHYITYIQDCVFGGVKLDKNADPDKFVCSDYSIGFYWCSEFSLPDGSIGKDVMISSVHIDNKKKISSFLVQVQHKDQIILRSAEAQYSINFSRSNRKFYLSLHYNESNSFLFANATKIY